LAEGSLIGVEKLSGFRGGSGTAVPCPIPEQTPGTTQARQHSACEHEDKALRFSNRIGRQSTVVVMGRAGSRSTMSGRTSPRCSASAISLPNPGRRPRQTASSGIAPQRWHPARRLRHRQRLMHVTVKQPPEIRMPDVKAALMPLPAIHNLIHVDLVRKNPKEERMLVQQLIGMLVQVRLQPQVKLLVLQDLSFAFTRSSVPMDRASAGRAAPQRCCYHRNQENGFFHSSLKLLVEQLWWSGIRPTDHSRSRAKETLQRGLATRLREAWLASEATLFTSPK